jgi:HEAT repeat protein
VQIGEPAIPGLVDVLKDGSSEVRRVATRALTRIGVAAVPRLLDTLRNLDEDVRMAAAGALAQIGEPAVPGLIDTLYDGDSDVRAAAARTLDEIGWHPTDVASKITYYIASGRWDDCVALGPIAIPNLLDVLSDQDCEVCEASAAALVQIGEPAVPGLLQALRDYYINRSYSYINQCYSPSCCILASVRALGQIGDATAVPDLIRALQDQNWKMHQAASKALERIGTPDALSAVQVWRRREQDKL